MLDISKNVYKNMKLDPYIFAATYLAYMYSMYTHILYVTYIYIYNLFSHTVYLIYVICVHFHIWDMHIDLNLKNKIRNCFY